MLALEKRAMLQISCLITCALCVFGLLRKLLLGNIIVPQKAFVSSF